MKWRENIDNLVRIGTFKQTDYIADDVRQYVLYAKEYLADAEKSETTRSRFLLAYEGMHSLSMAVLNRIEVRFDGSEGHRQTAFQAALLVIEVDELRKGASAAIMGFHRTRNAVTYQSPFPPMSEKVGNAAIEALKFMLAAAESFSGPIPKGPEVLTIQLHRPSWR